MAAKHHPLTETALDEKWLAQVGLKPIKPLVLDNRSDAEKAAQARLINAEAEEKEHKNWYQRLSIGWAYFWRFALVFVMGFAVGKF